MYSMKKINFFTAMFLGGLFAACSNSPHGDLVKKIQEDKTLVTVDSMARSVIRQGLNLVLAKLNLNLNATYVTYVLTGVIIVIAILMDIAKTNKQNKVKVEKVAKEPAKK